MSDLPETQNLSFENSDIGYAEFYEILQQHDSIQIINGNQSL